jgi:hypothetical protein
MALPWCRYYESAAAHLNDAYAAASALYDADSVPVARAIHARALLMRDLGDLSEASRLLPQVPRALLTSHLPCSANRLVACLRVHARAFCLVLPLRR